METKIWYEQLGYKRNPFTIKPAFFDDEVIGYDKEVDFLVSKLSKDSICFLEGEYGRGKSTIINYIINEFEGRNKIISVSRNKSDRALNYTSLLIKTNNFFGRLLNIRATNVILIVDEVSKINAKDCEQIEALFNSKFFKAILFADISLKNSHLSDSLKKKIGRNVVSLKEISAENAVELVKTRMDTKGIISDELIKKIFDNSNHNIRFLFENLEKVFKISFEKGKTKIDESDLNSI